MDSRTNIAVEVVGVSAANKTTIMGAATGFLGWAAQINWIGLIGVVVAVLGLAANVYFQVRRDRRETAESLARMEALKDRCDL